MDSLIFRYDKQRRGKITMDRVEKLNILHSIPVKVRITVLPSEGALECQYMTSNGEKNEWIGLDAWPATKFEESKVSKYCLTIAGERHVFDDYQSFELCFIEKWIGEVTPWEDFSDDVLDEWIEMTNDCDGIPFKE